MAQEFQRKPMNPQLGEIDQNVLVEALSEALVRTAQGGNVVQEQPDEDGTVIDLVELFFHVLSKVHFVILAALLGALLAGLYATHFVVPKYQATAKLYILNQSGINVSMADIQVASNLTNDYQEVFKTWEVHEMVREELDLNYSYGQLQSMVKVSNPSDTRLLYITATHADPEMAMQIANAYARAAKNFIYQVMEGEEPNEFSIALEPGEAIGMSRMKYLLLGFVAGAALVVGILVLMFLLDDRPHTPDDITKVAGIPTLAVVPREQTKGQSRRKVKKTRKEGKA